MKKIQLLFLSFVLFFACHNSKNEAFQSSHDGQKFVSTGPKRGTLIITGDAIYGTSMDKFKELIGGANAPIIVIPTASTSEELSKGVLDNYKQSYNNQGFNNVTVLHTKDPKVANTDEFIEPIKNAMGVIFEGGRQWRLADSYLNTKAHDEFMKLLDRGGVIAGGSAGATIQGSFLARGDMLGNIKMMGDHEVGFGFITNVAIDQHLLVRNRQFDMFEILDNRPELLGIGLDEKTGIIVQGDKFRVFGESFVAIYDGTRWSQERDTIYKLPKGSREFYLLKAGDEYNLKTRSVITYRNRKFLNLTESDLKKYCGEYQLAGTESKSEFFVKNGSLFSKVNNQTFSLLPESETRFYLPKLNVYVDFRRDSTGKILKAIIPAQHQIWDKLN